MALNSNAAPIVKKHRFAGKLAIVTASTAGIGLEIARRLAQEGATVLISSRKEAHVRAVEEKLRGEGLEVKGVVCHVGKRTDLKNLVRSALSLSDEGKIDVLVSNAGISPTLEPLATTSEKAIDSVLANNIKAPILLMQECRGHFSRDASVVLTSSIMAYHPVQEVDIMGMYAISKTALIGVMKAFANEWGKHGIRVNCVAPGFIPTKLSETVLQDDAYRQKLERSIPMRRLGTAPEIAAVVCFLLSTDAAYITGETIVIGGGMQSRL